MRQIQLGRLLLMSSFRICQSTNKAFISMVWSHGGGSIAVGGSEHTIPRPRLLIVSECSIIMFALMPKEDKSGEA